MCFQCAIFASFSHIESTFRAHPQAHRADISVNLQPSAIASQLDEVVPSVGDVSIDLPWTNPSKQGIPTEPLVGSHLIRLVGSE